MVYKQSTLKNSNPSCMSQPNCFRNFILELGCSVAAFLPPANQTHQHYNLPEPGPNSLTQWYHKLFFTTLFTQCKVQCVIVKNLSMLLAAAGNVISPYLFLTSCLVFDFSIVFGYRWDYNVATDALIQRTYSHQAVVRELSGSHYTVVE